MTHIFFRPRSRIERETIQVGFPPLSDIKLETIEWGYGTLIVMSWLTHGDYKIYVLPYKS